MSEQARLARLTELAREAWSTLQDVRVYADWRGHASVTYPDSPVTRQRLISFEAHPRALDALEAALLVLADEARIPLTADQVTRDALEKLAEEWEARHRIDHGTSYMKCARELRARIGKPMRVTDEMVERGYAAQEYMAQSKPSVRAVLEAALADVPEPNDPAFLSASQEAMGRAFYVDVVRAEARIAELEAKLEKVRAWACELSACPPGDLLAILDRDA